MTDERILQYGREEVVPNVESAQTVEDFSQTDSFVYVVSGQLDNKTLSQLSRQNFKFMRASYNGDFLLLCSFDGQLIENGVQIGSGYYTEKFTYDA